MSIHKKIIVSDEDISKLINVKEILEHLATVNPLVEVDTIISLIERWNEALAEIEDRV